MDLQHLPIELIRYIGSFLSLIERLGIKCSFEKTLKTHIIQPKDKFGFCISPISYFYNIRLSNQLKGFHFRQTIDKTNEYFVLHKNNFTYNLHIYETITSFEDILYEICLTIYPTHNNNHKFLFNKIMTNPCLLHGINMITPDDCLQTINEIELYWVIDEMFGYQLDTKQGNSQILYKMSILVKQISEKLENLVKNNGRMKPLYIPKYLENNTTTRLIPSIF